MILGLMLGALFSCGTPKEMAPKKTLKKAKGADLERRTSQLYQKLPQEQPPTQANYELPKNSRLYQALQPYQLQPAYAKQ